jgi:hypothetical protein
MMCGVTSSLMGRVFPFCFSRLRLLCSSVRIEELETVEGLTEVLGELWSGANGIPLDQITAVQPKLLRYIHPLRVPKTRRTDKRPAFFLADLNEALREQVSSVARELGYTVAPHRGTTTFS